jgi:hemoglobin-like flavoprotein
MTTQSALIDCLELVGEHSQDPTPLVYERLFRDFPEVEAQFILDTDDSAKGQMLFQFIECILDHVGEQHFADTFMQSEIVNHEGQARSRLFFVL